jgi:hypothetical protein
MAERQTRPLSAAVDARVVEGQRNVELTSLGGTMRRKGMSERAIRAALVEENTARCDPPLPEQEVGRIARSVAKYPPPEESDRKAEKGHRPSQADLIVAIAADAELFHGPDGVQYATVPANGHYETWPLRSLGFHGWINQRFHAQYRRVPAAPSISDALGVLDGKAQYEGPERPVFIRVGEDGDGTIYLDLGGPTWDAVEITSDGWRLVSEPPIRFRRAGGLLPLHSPAQGGSLNALGRFLNVSGDADWVLLVGWLLAALQPRGPFPVLILQGEQGTAKSTTQRVLRSLVDPNEASLRAGPRDIHDLMITSRNGWVISLDNLSGLPGWLSDAICRLTTGGGWATRELYSDTDEVIIKAQRPVILNGIEDLAVRGDFVDRSFIVYLPTIPTGRQRPEREFWREFESSRPSILGALLDAVSTALRRRESVPVPEVPRMIDIAHWVTAAEPALGCPSGTFVAAYLMNREAANELPLEASAVAELVSSVAEEGDWSGTASRLLATLSERVDDTIRRRKGWPGTPQALGNTLRRLAPNLRAVGVEIKFSREPGGTRRRLISIIRSSRKIAGVAVPPVPEAHVPDRMEDKGDVPGSSARDNRDDRDGHSVYLAKDKALPGDVEGPSGD